jgi:PAS domain S-box-containing protein
MRKPELPLHAERWHEGILDGLAEGVLVQDAEGRIVASNPAARSILGLEVEEVAGRTSIDPAWGSVWSDGTPARGDDLPSTIARKTGKPVRDVVVGVRHPSGIVRWLRTSAMPLRDGSGEDVVGAVVSFSDISEERRVQEALADNAALLTETQEIAKIGGWVYDVASHKATWTDEVYRIHEVTREFDPSLSLERDVDFYAPEDRATIDDAFRRAVEEGRPYDLELRLVTGKGREIWVRTAGRPKLEHGRVVRVYGHISDLTASRESAAKYRGLLEAAPDAMVVVDGVGEIVLLNAQAERQFGYRRHELVGQPITNIIPSGFAERLIADDLRSAADALAQQIGTGIELVALRKDGTEFPIEMMLSPLDSGDGILVTAAIRDISARKAADEALRVALSRFQAVVDAGMVGIFFARQGGRVFYANDYFLDLVGFTRKELERGELDWRAITPLEWLPDTDVAVTEMIDRGVSRPFEKEYVRRDGRRVPVFLADTRLPGTGEDMAAFVLDIGQLKRAEEELRALNIELEGRVSARTAALEAANRELEAFSYSVSHDLRAPLRSIDAFSQILLQEHAAGLDTEARRVLDVVVRNAQHMGQLIDDLLALSRIGRKELERKPVDMEILARSVAEELLAAHADRTVQFDIGPLCGAIGDASLLRQVWVNLFDNAVKFTGPVEHARVEVRCESGPHQRRFTVSDNGVGFDARYGDKLFQPFQRLHQTSEFEGTGIGLAIVARIVRRLGGEVWADSAPGAGATFGFSLPATMEAI